ncbi:MAG: hypothetical protein JWN60_2685 [Acidobacteria bacterium]|jgi:hypothetical protein|nr:hypothetical protein [Acidobacteriota bacterium]
MRKNGILTVVLYLISLVFFMIAMYRIDLLNMMGTIGAIFFIAATVILAVMIKKRSRTRRV